VRAGDRAHGAPPALQHGSADAATRVQELALLGSHVLPVADWAGGCMLCWEGAPCEAQLDVLITPRHVHVSRPVVTHCALYPIPIPYIYIAGSEHRLLHACGDRVGPRLGGHARDLGARDACGARRGRRLQLRAARACAGSQRLGVPQAEG